MQESPCQLYALFSEDDFEKIDRIYQGSKQEASGKIGRRGLGFRAIYNFTDLPTAEPTEKLHHKVKLYGPPNV